jgi:hypothetical protein
VNFRRFEVVLFLCLHHQIILPWTVFEWIMCSKPTLSVFFFESLVRRQLSLKSTTEFTLTVNLPPSCAPLTVVTRITPFTPCSPYNAAPWAPLRTLRPINSGGNCCNAAADEIALSITIKASLFPVIERDPLSTILVPPFTPPEVLLICKTETLPTNDCTTFG